MEGKDAILSRNNQLSVLVTAFACSPDHGSEPGVGWGWVVALSKVCRLTVLTASCNRASVEAYRKRDETLQVNFIFEDVSSLASRLNLKAKSKLGVVVRLFLWQHRIKKVIRALVSDYSFDVLHHLTLASFRLPFSVAGHGVPSVVGPVGGSELFPGRLLPENEMKIRLRELARNAGTLMHSEYGVGMSRYENVGLTISCTKEMSRVFACWGVTSPVLPIIGMSDKQLNDAVSMDYSTPKAGELRLLFVGNLLFWKGLELAVQAIKELPPGVTLSCVGKGADQLALEQLVCDYGLRQRVKLIGSFPRDELLKKYSSYDVFLFPSVHDSGGMAVIEAMRAGLPVICLDAGGPGLSVTPDCGRLIPLGAKMDVIRGIQDAIKHYLSNPSDIAKHGREAQQRVCEAYNWDKNAITMIEYYQRLSKRKQD